MCVRNGFSSLIPPTSSRLGKRDARECVVLDLMSCYLKARKSFTRQIEHGRIAVAYRGRTAPAFGARRASSVIGAARSARIASSSRARLSHTCLAHGNSEAMAYYGGIYANVYGYLSPRSSPSVFAVRRMLPAARRA